MSIEIGQIEAIFRYPVKSIRGALLDVRHVGRARARRRQALRGPSA
jgi:uncharacterized protein YcbX